jgi:hypothetical protein
LYWRKTPTEAERKKDGEPDRGRQLGGLDAGNVDTV